MLRRLGAHGRDVEYGAFPKEDDLDLLRFDDPFMALFTHLLVASSQDTHKYEPILATAQDNRSWWPAAVRDDREPVFGSVADAVAAPLASLGVVRDGRGHQLDKWKKPGRLTLAGDRPLRHLRHPGHCGRGRGGLDRMRRAACVTPMKFRNMPVGLRICNSFN